MNSTSKLETLIKHHQDVKRTHPQGDSVAHLTHQQKEGWKKLLSSIATTESVENDVMRQLKKAFQDPIVLEYLDYHQTDENRHHGVLNFYLDRTFKFIKKKRTLSDKVIYDFMLPKFGALYPTKPVYAVAFILFFEIYGVSFYKKLRKCAKDQGLNELAQIVSEIEKDELRHLSGMNVLLPMVGKNLSTIDRTVISALLFVLTVDINMSPWALHNRKVREKAGVIGLDPDDLTTLALKTAKKVQNKILEVGTMFSDRDFEVGNAENLTLADFVSSEGRTLGERVKPFAQYYEMSVSEGRALYSREIVGPVKNHTLVKDLRTGIVREMIMLGSNNYLGLTTHPRVQTAAIHAIQEFGTGMGGPPLLNGMSTVHRELEHRLAHLKGGSRAENTYDGLLFGSGYQANLGWIKGLMRRGDVLIYDELSHASLYDGIAQLGGEASSGIRCVRFRHNQCWHLEKLLRKFQDQFQKANSTGQMFVAIEGVYSMDGDLAPIPDIHSLCKKFGAVLVVDDAHGTGVIGSGGAGTAEHFGLHGEIDISMGTFSKTFGATGGFLVARKEVVDYLRFFARSYMFSAHLPPSTAATVLAGLDILKEEPVLINQLHENAGYLRRGLNDLGLQVKNEAAILPIMIPKEVDIRVVAQRVHEEGVFLNSVEYPAVPQMHQRLRASVMATHTREDLDQVIAVFKKIKQEFHL